MQRTNNKSVITQGEIIAKLSKYFFLTAFLSIFLFFNTNISAQQQSFSADSIKYVKELKTFMSKSKQKDSKQLLKEFENLWETGVIDEHFRRDIYKHSNAMLKKRARAFPHFELYLNNIIALAKNNMHGENYKTWAEHLSTILSKRETSSNKLKVFLRNSLSLFSQGSLFQNTMVNWRMEDIDYELESKNLDLLVHLQKTTLTCFAKRDSTKIHETQGYFSLNELIYHGKSGIITWERSNISRDSIMAKLDHFKINLKKSEYTIDTVLFYNKEFFDKPMYGSLTDKVVVQSESQEISYPRFTSFTKRFELKNIFKDINYAGGFSMKGDRFFGSGTREELATLSFFRKDTLILDVRTTSFVFKRGNVISPNAATVFYFDKDSMYHPGLKFNFNIEKREVKLTRDKENMGRAPYVNTYHGLDMLVGKVIWKMTQPKLELISGPLEKISYFESADFYSEEKYLNLQKMDDINPLTAVRRFVKRNGGYNEFHAADFGNYMRMSLSATHKYLLNLAFEGFITYDIDNEIVTVKDKLYHYLVASVGKKDYDIIGFVSNTNNSNGEISLLNYDFKMKGINQVFLSDSQNVVIFPKNGIINLQKNRDFNFDGRVSAGLFDFYGTEFSFSYKNFKIDLNNVERLQMYLKSKTEYDKYGDPVLIPIQSKIQNVKGDLIIDKPFNKSGIQSTPNYPIFISKKESYVYYDSPDIQDGAYHKDDFYFQIIPYTLDSLKDLTRKNLIFDGHFVSADIFPDFEQQLKVRPDYSLGFVKETTATGLPMYKGKGNYVGIIDLSNRGLLGNGDLKYINSITSSEKIVMLPEQYKAFEAKFNNPTITAPPEFPFVKGNDVRVDWYANLDSLVTKSKENPIKIYNDTITISGYTYLQPNGMSGKGLIDLQRAEMSSNLYRFKAHTFKADTADFLLKGKGKLDFEFKTNNVNAFVDFNKRKAVLKSNGEGSYSEFKVTQYVCFMDKFIWYMDGDTIQMETQNHNLNKVKYNDDLGPITEKNPITEGSQFISTRFEQDSLNFIAQSATYNTKTKEIFAKGVKYIRVADAIIYPKNGLVEIAKEATMRSLEESQIIANSDTRFHTINNASTKINGRKDYLASGEYDYYNQDKIKQIIHFSEIGVTDSTMHTYGKGKIEVNDDFTFSPQFAYNGRVRLNSDEEKLLFNGYTQIAHSCDTATRQWLKFKSEIDPEEIMIPFNKRSKNINEQKLHASLMITNDSTHIYPAFIDIHKKYSDVDIVPVEGYLTFDKQEGKYIISSKEKLENPELSGNYVSLHHEICNFYGEGKINLGTDFGRFKLKSAGNVTSGGPRDTTTLNLVSFIKFPFNNKCLEIMAKDLKLAIDGIDPLDVYYKSIPELVEKEAAEDYLAALSVGSLKKYPKIFEEGILLSELKLIWNDKKRVYESDGLIGIGNILKKQVNRLVEGRVIIKKSRRGDEIYIYLEPEVGVWYYFHMSRNVLKAVSSNNEFNTTLRNMKPKNRRISAEKYEKTYSFYPGTPALLKGFFRKFAHDEEPEMENENDNNDEVEDENY